MTRPTVGIVILNWNKLDLTKRCLKSVREQTYPTHITFLVDNGSTDGSVAWLKKQSELLPIFNSKNLGFARAINQGMKAAIDSGCKYIVSLNNDTVVDSNWLGGLVQFMENSPNCGFAQGSSMQENERDVFDSTGIYLEKGFIPNQRALGKKDPLISLPVIGPNAAGSIYRASMLTAASIKTAEYFDSRFFAYVEDVDLNLRCTLRGYNYAFVPEAILYHVGSATGNSIAKKKMYWGARNMVWLIYKNAPLPVLRYSFRLIVKSHMANLQFLWREQRKNFWPYLYGLIIGVLCIPRFYFDRRRNLKAQTISNDAFIGLLVPSNPPLTNPFKKLLNLVR